MSPTGHGDAMTRIQSVIVRDSTDGAILEWRPPSGDAKLTELVQMLEDRHVGTAGTVIDLLEEATGLPVDPDTSVDALGEPKLVARDRFVGHALRQIAAVRGQFPSLLDFHFTQGSPVVRLELRCPALVRTDEPGRAQVRIRGRHELLMVLPRSFPTVAPRLIWLTPIFHPNIVADHDAWPPSFTWEEQPSLVALLGALVDTLVGLNVATTGRLSLARQKPLDPDASSWFRKHGRAIADLGRQAVHGHGRLAHGIPIVSSGTTWILEGAVAGGGPLVFLSHRFRHGFCQFSEDAAGWLIGRHGEWKGSRWVYIDRLAPYYIGSARPESAIGVSHGPVGGAMPASPALAMPLGAEMKDGRPVFRLDGHADEVSGYFVEYQARPGPATTETREYRDGASQIRVGAPSGTAGESDATTQDDAPQGSGEDNAAGILTERALDYPECGYCGSYCDSDREWGTCPQCRDEIHTDCSEQLGGCANTECRRSPLYIDR
jgi:hypothetical protein